MTLVQFYVPFEIARQCIAALGSIGNVQFRDMNKNTNSFQRSFVKEIRKYDETERQIRFIYETIKKQQIRIPLTSFDHLLVNKNDEHPSKSYLEDTVRLIGSYEHNIRHMSETFEELLERKLDLVMHRKVLSGTRSFFDSRLSIELDAAADGNRGGNNLRLNDSSDDEFLISDNETETDAVLLEAGFGRSENNNNKNSNNTPTSTGLNEMNILGATMNFIAGTIALDRFAVLEKICWRALRGNLYINHIPIEEPVIDPKSGEQSYKCIFLIFTHGETLIQKCKKIVDSLDGSLYSVNAEYDIYKQELDSVNNKLRDLSQVLEHTEERLIVELKEIALEIEKWKIEIKREKSIYHILNLLNFDENRRVLIGEGWIPSDDLPIVKSTLARVSQDLDEEWGTVVHTIQTNKVPPTFHKTNKFTSAFQSIIDAYGIATYQEVNPGLATVVTFPFMFAIMFGDLGHGFVLFLAALSLVLMENKIGKMKNRDEIFDMAYTGRYILLLMGFFSMYTGLMYNDLFSKSMTLFKSGWKWPIDFKEGQTITATQSGVYSIGLDPAWHGTENNLLFTNSYKMKLSILMGFAHMSYSFYFSFVNYKFFNSKVDIIGNFIPGLLFMQSIFGYLSLTIIYKWCVDWIAIGKPAPGLLDMLINMFLSPGTVDVSLYPGQGFIQVILLLIALVCVPWLLLYKPLILKRQNAHGITLGYVDVETSADSRFSIESVSTDANPFEDLVESSNNVSQNSTSGNGALIDDEIAQILANVHEEDEPEPFNFGDIMVHQVIHTIEFCLNCVSHTASYLRLWALSLAHNQLSAVLWEMTIENGFVAYNEGGKLGSVILVFLFGMWFTLTVAILVVMEGTSAMLHSLRLHWVEAMSKFFEGEGYAYEPYSFWGLGREDEE